MSNTAFARLALFLAFFVAAAAGRGAPADAAELASDWVKGFNNEARLIAGVADAGSGSALFAGVEIAMPPGWKTYWRTPGEAGGVPPEFDWSASENLASAKVLYPAPSRLTDKSGVVVGYHDRVLFPLEIAPADRVKPILLRVKAAYGVCKELCIPAEAEFTLEIPPGAAPSDAIARAIALTPRYVARAGVDPVLKSWTFEKPRLTLEVADPAGADFGDAFVEAPDSLYVPLPKLIERKGGVSLYEVDLSDGADIAALSGKALTVTLIGAKGQSETTITLQ